MYIIIYIYSTILVGNFHEASFFGDPRPFHWHGMANSLEPSYHLVTTVTTGGDLHHCTRILHTVGAVDQEDSKSMLFVNGSGRFEFHETEPPGLVERLNGKNADFGKFWDEKVAWDVAVQYTAIVGNGTSPSCVYLESFDVNPGLIKLINPVKTVV